mmetsp:Transcript_11936/g.24707  ORF Transcript_11936/g.24707 Transcript_11936/m.24707 type:complete len:88 (-) Transcript_11936:112-375(-)
MRCHNDSEYLQTAAWSVLVDLTDGHSDYGNRIAVQSVLGLLELADLPIGAAAAGGRESKVALLNAGKTHRMPKELTRLNAANYNKHR